jgi:hypothetical protein
MPTLQADWYAAESREQYDILFIKERERHKLDQSLRHAVSIIYSWFISWSYTVMLHGTEWQDDVESIGKDVVMSYVKPTPRAYLVAVGRHDF